MKVYLIQMEGTNVYKIGATKQRVDERLRQLQTGNGKKLIKISEYPTQYGYKLETALHAQYRLERIDENSEWFTLTVEQVKQFPAVCAKLEEIFHILKDNYFFDK
jgi:hypothetical protein